MIIRSVIVLLVVLITGTAHAQVLKPGFDADEYIDVLERCAMQINSPVKAMIPKETNYDRVYTSPDMGLHNKWNLWISKDKMTMVVNLRGTTGDPDSWIENFYSAMIPAIGTLKLNDSNTYSYHFADDPKALVHVGWTLGACSLLPDIIAHVRTYAAQGIKQLIVEGHSQGGALSFLVSSQLYHEVAAGNLPKGLVIKTYCSAAPKPGNMYFAYDYDYVHRGDWSFTVVNGADWVPETPFSIQTLNDMNPTNPLTHAKPTLRKQKFFIRLYTTHVYNQLSKSSRKAQRKYEKYLGRVVGKQLKRFVPQYVQPAYVHSGNYMRAGNPVVLQPDAAYYAKYPVVDSNVFRHHLFDAYFYLVNKIYK